LQVEGGVKGVGEVDEIGEVSGLNAYVDGVKMSQGVGGGGRAVVAFELVVFRRRWGI
jgi:hypothetical protein